MPNLENMRRREQAERMRVLKANKDKDISEQRTLRRARYEAMQSLFQHPAWEAVTDEFLEMEEEALSALRSSMPMTQDQVAATRGLLIAANLVLRLDTWVSERIESLSKADSREPAGGQEP